MLIIRQETSDDIQAITSVLEQAFNRSQEAKIVESLRDQGAMSLSLVATINEQVVGHILFSPVTLGIVKAVGLAPLAVLPNYQKQGIGSQLVKKGLLDCQQAGYEIVVVLGHPEFYTRFGFESASDYGIIFSEDIPQEYFLVKKLCPDVLVGTLGMAKYQPEFYEI